MRIRPVGANALLLELPNPSEAGVDVASTGGVDVAGTGIVEAWRAEVWRRRTAGEFAATDIVPGACTILIDGITDVARLAEILPTWAPRPGSASGAGKLIEIPIWYDGPDLDAVARYWRMSVPDVIAAHLDTEFRVAFCGFAPGFGYLTGLPAGLAVPRLATPRTRVPAGSVGLADIYCGIYPNDSPGGWLLIGRTGVRLFDITSQSPALLAPGVRVRFVRAEP